jgi:hypothetical protein
MTIKDDLKKWVLDAIDAKGGQANLVEVANSSGIPMKKS